MDADTLAALTVINQRLAVLEANEASATSAATVAQIQANAAAVQNAEALQEMQEQALRLSQARAQAWAASRPPYPGPHP